MTDPNKALKDLLADNNKFTALCKSIFSEMDKDKSGTIDTKELEAALTKMSKQSGVPAPTKKDLDDTLKIFDKNKDGKIQFEEFVTVTKESYEKIIKSNR
jgi:Ca2+-binding EF-hand superfamily protein